MAKTEKAHGNGEIDSFQSRHVLHIRGCP